MGGQAVLAIQAGQAGPFPVEEVVQLAEALESAQLDGGIQILIGPLIAFGVVHRHFRLGQVKDQAAGEDGGNGISVGSHPFDGQVDGVRSGGFIVDGQALVGEGLPIPLGGIGVLAGEDGVVIRGAVLGPGEVILPEDEMDRLIPHPGQGDLSDARFPGGQLCCRRYAFGLAHQGEPAGCRGSLGRDGAVLKAGLQGQVLPGLGEVDFRSREIRLAVELAEGLDGRR